MKTREPKGKIGTFTQLHAVQQILFIGCLVLGKTESYGEVVREKVKQGA